MEIPETVGFLQRLQGPDGFLEMRRKVQFSVTSRVQNPSVCLLPISRMVQSVLNCSVPNCSVLLSHLLTSSYVQIATV